MSKNCDLNKTRSRKCVCSNTKNKCSKKCKTCIPKVTHYKYLGLMFQDNMQWDMQGDRIVNGLTYNKRKRNIFWKNQTTHPGAKHKLYKACCTCKAYYGSEVIELSKKDRERIDNKIMKQIKEIFKLKQNASALLIRMITNGLYYKNNQEISAARCLNSWNRFPSYRIPKKFTNMIIIWSDAVDKRQQLDRKHNRHPEKIEMRHKWCYIGSNLSNVIRIPAYNKIIKSEVYNKRGIASAGVKNWKHNSASDMSLRKRQSKYEHYNYAALNYKNQCQGRDTIMNIITCAQLSAWINIIGEGDDVTKDYNKVCPLCGKNDSTEHAYEACEKLPYHDKLLRDSSDTKLKPFNRKIAIIKLQAIRTVRRNAITEHNKLFWDNNRRTNKECIHIIDKVVRVSKVNNESEEKKCTITTDEEIQITFDEGKCKVHTHSMKIALRDGDVWKNDFGKQIIEKTDELLKFSCIQKKPNGEYIKSKPHKPMLAEAPTQNNTSPVTALSERGLPEGLANGPSG